ncbi:MAG TPA: hypothetical protein VGF23_17355 [Gaiellaceae bacterium]|jgi:hypothetical protein
MIRPLVTTLVALGVALSATSAADAKNYTFRVNERLHLAGTNIWCSIDRRETVDVVTCLRLRPPNPTPIPRSWGFAVARTIVGVIQWGKDGNPISVFRKTEPLGGSDAVSKGPVRIITLHLGDQGIVAGSNLALVAARTHRAPHEPAVGVVLLESASKQVPNSYGVEITTTKVVMFKGSTDHPVYTRKG